MANSRGRAGVVVLIFLSALVLVAGNLFFQIHRSLAPAPGGGVAALQRALTDAYRSDPAAVLFYAAAPLAVAILLALVAGRRRESAAGEAAPAAGEAVPSIPPETAALRLLALLQQEGRLIDFLEEDIEDYSDAQVGTAVRSIHAGCRKALHERMRIHRIFAEEDGATVEVEPGFDSATVRLTGNVHGQPPFRGTLQHGGWRAAEIRLPQASSDLDATILAPAEVELS